MAIVVGREGVMKMGDGSNVPRVKCHGKFQETGRLVDEIGENGFDKILREIGDWGRTRGECLGDTSEVG